MMMMTMMIKMMVYDTAMMIWNRQRIMIQTRFPHSDDDDDDNDDDDNDDDDNDDDDNDGDDDLIEGRRLVKRVTSNGQKDIEEGVISASD